MANPNVEVANSVVTPLVMDGGSGCLLAALPTPVVLGALIFVSNANSGKGDVAFGGVITGVNTWVSIRTAVAIA